MSAFRVSVSAAARRDIDEAEDWLSQQASVRTAAFVLERIAAQLERLDVSGAPIPRCYGAKVRFVVAAPYLIYYEVDGDFVAVLRVLHRARDRDAIMG